MTINHFKGKQFQQDVIIVTVGYYLRYNLSYREVQEILYDRGINVSHTTIYRWVDSELDQPGTYVLMKSGRKMNQVKEILERSGREVRMVENCGMPDEHIYNSVEEIPDDAGYYSLIIAKEKAEEK